MGSGFEDGTDVGPVISQASLQRIHMLIQSGVDDGAELALDGRGVTVPGYEQGARYCGGCV